VCHAPGDTMKKVTVDTTWQDHDGWVAKVFTTFPSIEEKKREKKEKKKIDGDSWNGLKTNFRECGFYFPLSFC
jgi:hypothetical protein